MAKQRFKELWRRRVFIVREIPRLAVADVLLDAATPMSEEELVDAAMNNLKETNWKANREEIRTEVAKLESAGLAERKGSGYQLTKQGREAADSLLNVPRAAG